MLMHKFLLLWMLLLTTPMIRTDDASSCKYSAADALDDRDLDFVNEGNIVLRTSHGTFVTCDQACTTSLRSGERSQLELVKPDGDDDNTVCFKTPRYEESSNEPQYFVSIEDDFSISLVARTGCSEREKFEMIDVDSMGTIALRSVVYGTYLSADGNVGSKIRLVEQMEEWETFALETGRTFREEQHLRKHGFTVLEDVLTSEEAADIRDIVTQVESNMGRVEVHDGTAAQIRVPDLLIHHSSFAELLVHPRVLSVVQRYLHKKFRCATWSSNTLLPNMTTPALGWHVDYPYHDIEQPWPVEPLSVQVLWMIDDFTAENGGTMFMPNSHQWLREPYYDFATPREATTINGRAGSVMVAHGAWWHRQTPNKTWRSRVALLANFCRGFVVPKADMEGQLIELKEKGLDNYLDSRQKIILDRLIKGWHDRATRGYRA